MQRIPSLDGLRAISITIVLLAHFNHFWHFKVLDYLVNAGIVGVYIFFVISGFLITTLLIKEKNKTNITNLKKFYIRRIYRIFPLSIFYILVIITISFFNNPSLKQNFWIPALYLSNISGLGTVNYVFLHYWSLSAEEQYYIIIPSLFKLNSSKFKLLLILIFISSFFFRFLSARYHQIQVFQILNDLTRNLDGLIVGSYLAILYSQHKLPLQFINKHKHLINILGFSLLLFLNHETDLVYLKVFANHAFYSIIIALLIIANIQPSEDYFYKFLNHKWVVKIGIISYSIYIWQQLFSSGMIPLPSFINFILVFVVSFLSYQIIEKPFLNIKNKFKIV
jgi:peptidoglycan/LPS O-acetylase OafA/YrhL